MKEKKDSKKKYKSPNTIAEINHQSNLRELSDFIINPENYITDAIIICMDKDGFVTYDSTEKTTQIKVFGMIEFAKSMMNDQ
jgi:hypothetical protein